jgi:hypothetical protein
VVLAVCVIGRPQQKRTWLRASAKPPIISAQLAGSGTAREMEEAVSRRLKLLGQAMEMGYALDC